jgi:hypothetical protein
MILLLGFNNMPPLWGYMIMGGHLVIDMSSLTGLNDLDNKLN